MAFTKTTWIDNTTPLITAAQLNRIEQGIYDAHQIPLFAVVSPVPVANGGTGSTTAANARTALGTPTYQPEAAVTSLPGSPVDGQEVYYVADATNGVVWHLKYRSADPSSYKWQYVGGRPLIAEVLTDEATSSTSFTTLATAGPSITVPLAGDYDIEIGSIIAAPGGQGYMSYAIGGLAAADADAVRANNYTSAGQIWSSNSRIRRKNVGAASTSVAARYRSSAGTSVNFLNRYMAVTPVRVG